MASLTIEHIAALAAVSRSTVSRVINDHPHVRPAIRQRVQRVITEQGYAPQAAARSLAGNRTGTISLLIPRSAASLFTDPFYPLILQALTGACTDADYRLLLWMAGEVADHQFQGRVLHGRHSDGFILLASDVDDPLLPALLDSPFPVVQIGRNPHHTALCTVDSDNRDGARQAMAHLLDLGHRRIATITGPLRRAVAQDRRDGYAQALSARGVPLDPSLLVESNFSAPGGYGATRQFLALAERPTTIFVAGDVMVLGAREALREAGLRVPEDISLVGFDDLPLAAHASPPLTTVRQPIADLGCRRCGSSAPTSTGNTPPRAPSRSRSNCSSARRAPHPVDHRGRGRPQAATADAAGEGPWSGAHLVPLAVPHPQGRRLRRPVGTPTPTSSAPRMPPMYKTAKIAASRVPGGVGSGGGALASAPTAAHDQASEAGSTTAPTASARPTREPTRYVEFAREPIYAL